MDPTIQFFWDRRYRGPTSEADWAIHLLEQGFESDAILRLTDRHMEWSDRERLIVQALQDIGRTELLDLRTIHDLYERESIADFFDGKFDGWTLILRCCHQYWSEPDLDPDRKFWSILADNANWVDGYPVTMKFHGKTGQEFEDEVKDAIRASNRPLPKGA